MEEALIERVQAGDDRGISELAATYSAKIFWVAFRYLRNREDAEEVVQDVLLTIARKSGTFRGDASLSTEADAEVPPPSGTPDDSRSAVGPLGGIHRTCRAAASRRRGAWPSSCGRSSKAVESGFRRVSTDVSC